MDKEEILERSRQELENKDLFAIEVSQQAGNYGAIVAAILATIFFVVQIVVGGGMNYGLYAVIFSIPATGYSIKAQRLRMKKDRRLAVVYVLATIFFSAIHLLELFSKSTIL